MSIIKFMGVLVILIVCLYFSINGLKDSIITVTCTAPSMTRSLAGTFWIFSITGVLLSGVGAIFYLKDGHLKNADKYFNELEKETRD